MKRVGFTTTVPVEIILASSNIPVDLNNIFITDPNPYRFLDYAEQDGLPRNTCNWIKGIYSAVMQGGADEVIVVTGGDCSNNHALAEIFASSGIKVTTFNYPSGSQNKYFALKKEMELLSEYFGVSFNAVQDYSNKLKNIRKKLKILDEMTVSGIVTGFENHLWLVSSTDFNGDCEAFEKALDNFLSEAVKRRTIEKNIRLGFIGVPPIFTDLYDFLDSKGVHIAFNEVQRQFSIVSEKEDIVEKYLDYTYPYDIYGRIDDIKNEVANRSLDGIIHYVQSFCYRQLQDIVLRKELDLPMITIEGNEPGGIDARTKIRLESFIEMIQEKKNV